MQLVLEVTQDAQFGSHVRQEVPDWKVPAGHVFTHAPAESKYGEVHLMQEAVVEFVQVEQFASRHGTHLLTEFKT